MSPTASASGTRPRRRGAFHSPKLPAVLAIGALFSSSAVLLAACSNTASGESTAGRMAAPQAGAHIPERRLAAVPAFGTASSARGRALVLSAQSIVYTAELTLKVKDVSATAATATGIVIGAGGYVAGEQDNIPHHSNGTPLITLALKVPVSAYHPTLARLAGLGTQIAFSQHAQDVTQRVADVGSRVASAEAAIKQLRALLGKAGTVSTLLQVQEEINSQEAELEALLAQQRALLHETSYGTVTVMLVGHHVMIVNQEKKKAAGGFGTGLRAGWHALVVFVRWLMTALGAALPFLIPIALLAAIAFESRRRLARRRTRPAADPPATAES